jgi:acyl-[acyl-carrier-protein]-phospholipid O-acyltransferase / long-chain-fatty-acid--[acyl-carrier-protein] ligase
MLLLTVLGIAYFWFAGTLAMQNIIELAKETVSSTALQGQLLTALSLGIGIGSVTAGFLSRGKIRMELIPAGGFGLAAFSAVLGMSIWGFWGSVVLLFGLGFFGGFFVIPLDAMLQKRSPEDMRGDMIATCNFVTFSGMTVSAVLFYLLFNFLGLSTSHIFLLIAVTSVTVGVSHPASCSLYASPISLPGVLPALAYRLKVVDADNVPRKGGALLVSNHVSFVDTVILSASTDRKIRYIGDKGYCNAFLLKPMAKLMGVLPVSAGGNAVRECKVAASGNGSHRSRRGGLHFRRGTTHPHGRTDAVSQGT